MSIITFASALGSRREQEDRLLWATVPEGTLLGVFDGHGGDHVALLLADQFPKIWSAFDGLDYLQTLVKAFEMANDITQIYREGSTASVVFIPTDETAAYIAVLGDSPVIAETAIGAVWLGPDHNARSNAEERSMAIARGGFYQNGYVWNDEYGDNARGLQMTRAFGDYECRKFLDRIPQVFRIPLGGFLLIASDGLVDPKHIKNSPDDDTPTDDIIRDIRAGRSVKQLVDRALAIPTNDNVTAILWRRE